MSIERVSLSLIRRALAQETAMAATTPYEHWLAAQDTVHFGRGMPVTNAACCNNSQVMCRNCAAAALAKLAGQEALLAAAAAGVSPAPDPPATAWTAVEAPLRPPVYNYGPA